MREGRERKEIKRDGRKSEEREGECERKGSVCVRERRECVCEKERGDSVSVGERRESERVRGE